MPNVSPTDPSMAVAAVLDLLIQQGYEATSVEELADAAGISRSTFFRKYGSKEGMVFADHDRILRQLNDHLTFSTGDPLQAVADAAAMVFDHHLHHRRTALARYQLLQQVPALRDRELVTSHSYERAFRLHLQAALPENARRDYGAIAVAAAMVAVHNAFLRQWLRAPDAVPAVELRSRLKGELAALAETFRRELYGSGSDGDRQPAVIVTVFESGANKQDILEAINRAIP
ncbi:TetR/AcrR family transcriptional regulator [Paenarthrobacter sp. 2TAF44]|uniref:TetR/AcrR family transcriptional regulator n=1 Tax=Paenarthrobacter sp. 2TAF44 TaxID=3233018 RepID=UPI003F9E28BB